MALVYENTASSITLYCTCEIPEQTLAVIKRDFGLGASEEYSPTLSLHIDERKDLYRLKSPEDVLRALQSNGTLSAHDNNFEPFLLADAKTVQDGDKGTLWMVDKWSQKEDYYDDALVPGADGGVQQGSLPFAEKLRIYSYYAPILYVNLEIANTDMGEAHNYPYDPYAEPEPDNGGADWRLERPMNAYVVADARNYEVSSSVAEGTQIRRLGVSPADDTDIRLYRLRSEVAKRLRLVPEWTTGSAWTSDRGSEAFQQKVKEGDLELSTAVSFTQPWDWHPPTLVEA